MTPDIIALDLEGTLISNGMSQIPRPGLQQFLINCFAHFDRVVIYSALNEHRIQDVLQNLLSDGLLTSERHQQLEVLSCKGASKDLNLIPLAVADQALLLDDMEAYVAPGQEKNWISIAPFEPPYASDDDALMTAWNHIAGHLLEPPA